MRAYLGKSVLLLGICLLGDTSSAQAPSPLKGSKAPRATGDAPVLFVATNADFRWAVQADLDGTLETVPGALRVSVSTLRLARPTRFTTGEEVIAVSASVSRTWNASWVAVRRSREYSVRRVLQPGQSLQLSGITFDIPTEELDLREDDYLTLTLYVRDPAKETDFATVYAHKHMKLPGSRPRSPSAEPPRSVVFQATSDPGLWPVDAEIFGQVERNDKDLRVSLHTGEILPTRYRTYQPIEIASLSLGVGRDGAGGWSVVRSSEPLEFNRPLAEKEVLTLRETEFRIPLDNLVLNSKDWLTVIVKVRSGSSFFSRTGLVYLRAYFDWPVR